MGEFFESYGVKGMKSAAWRRSFGSSEARERWCEQRDARVLGTRAVSREEAENEGVVRRLDREARLEGGRR